MDGTNVRHAFISEIILGFIFSNVAKIKPPPPAPKPDPLPPAPPVVPEAKSFVGFTGWGGVK